MRSLPRRVPGTRNNRISRSQALALWSVLVLQLGLSGCASLPFFGRDDESAEQAPAASVREQPGVDDAAARALAAAVGSPAHWSTRWDARWRSVRDGDQCRLELAVPRYGRAAFLTAQAGAARSRFAFELIASRDLMAPAPVSWRRRAPSWHPHYPSSTGWQPLQTVPGFGARIGMPIAERMALDLYGGYELDLGSAVAQPLQPEIHLRLSAIGFRPAFDAFQRCQEEGVPRSMMALKRTRIGFASASHRLSPRDRDKLRELARYILADVAVDRVYVDGHTDAVGAEGDNLSLSKQRAEAVRDELVAAGVSPSVLTIRYHGERYPVERLGANRPSAANRRATVRIETGEAMTSSR